MNTREKEHDKRDTTGIPAGGHHKDNEKLESTKMQVMPWQAHPHHGVQQPNLA